MTKKTTNTRTTPKKDKTEEQLAATFAEIMDRKQPPRIEVPLCQDTSLLDVRATALRKFTAAARLAANENADGAAKAEADRLEAEYLEADEAAKAATVTWVFHSTGRDTVEALLMAHPPTEEQLADAEATARAAGIPADQVPTYNAETFPPALMAECSHFPKMTLKDATELWNSDRFSRGELAILWGAVWNLNNGIRR